jgi:pimeloyl-ACP methyl ester carboxylesterase
MLDGFGERHIATGEAELYTRIGGSGPPLVCLHGYPQSHLTWRKVAPILAGRYTLVLPDLRGYGSSEIVASDEAHAAYSKRVMARDIVALMAALGYERFFLAGHDRGGRVAYRLALDAPERVAAIATLDIVPTLENWEAMDYRRAYSAYHWQFLAQPEPLPERLIGSDPEWYCAQKIGPRPTRRRSMRTARPLRGRAPSTRYAKIIAPVILAISRPTGPTATPGNASRRRCWHSGARGATASGRRISRNYGSVGQAISPRHRSRADTS